MDNEHVISVMDTKWRARFQRDLNCNPYMQSRECLPSHHHINCFYEDRLHSNNWSNLEDSELQQHF